ncbi:hypothetical protein [Pararhodobacter marinus]|uniref:Uncharacterized protein n=1 Tax=Pararhodobacter marinus TaxID=2184063 RepID=A0A2U2CE53_9RHOB|nr:hypothetical protein [Pararhodobacter marinus]PWE30166.1 hypothetical protein C4N9_05555 [Pararhodobacter marinus]
MKLASLAVFATFTASAGLAQDFGPALESFYRSDLSQLGSQPMILDAVRAQNALTGSYDGDRIATLDRAWQAELGQPETPTITPVLGNALSDHLRSEVEASRGTITEIIVMDAVGLNVAVSSATSDYWQGDEAKYTETYGSGPGALHLSDVELDESTGRYQGQISFTLTDPETGDPIGAITVGVDAEQLM